MPTATPDAKAIQPPHSSANPTQPQADRVLIGAAAEARPYQLRIAANALRMFRGTWRNRVGQNEPPAHSVLVESPTGSGKTLMALAIAHQMQQEFGFSIGWAAMRRNLLTQARNENQGN